MTNDDCDWEWRPSSSDCWGAISPVSTHSPRGRVIFPFYDLLYLASVLALETVSILGISCIFPDCHFPLLCAVKYSTVYYHFIWLHFFPLTVVWGSLDPESLPLSNSICLNVKKKEKKKVELFTVWHFWGNIW